MRVGNTGNLYSIKNRVINIAILVVVVIAPHTKADVAQIPLFLVDNVKPNVMLMIDNSGSMNHIVADAPYVAATTYLTSCPAANLIPAGASVELRISSSQPRIFYSGTNYVWGTGSGQRCFANNSLYDALLTTSSTASATGGGADYNGNYLNWYFNRNNTSPTWTSGQTQKPGASSRIQVARQSSVTLVNNLSDVRLGLTTYNSGDGGSLREIVGDLTSTKKTNLVTKINALSASGSTPLAETLLDIGRYFVTGTSSTQLTLYPGSASPSNQTISAIFSQGSVSNHNLKNDSGQTISNPVQSYCQKNFTVMVTDGRPNGDRAINNSTIRDYSKDCSVKNLCNSTSTTTNLPVLPITNTGSTSTCDSSNRNFVACKNGTKAGRTYESQGSDFMDDIAMALNDIDLRPDLVPADPTKSKPGKNNLITHVIGFADGTVLNDPLLVDTAARGGGLFFSAQNATELAQKLEDAFVSIRQNLASASAAAANSSRFQSDNLLFRGIFSSIDWTGDLLAFRLTTEDANSNGELDPGEDADGDGKIDEGVISNVPLWEASKEIPAANSRNIFTYDPQETAASKGILFEWGELNKTQKNALDPTNVNASSSPVLNYLRGDQTREDPALTNRFRKRSKLIGDLINSDPLFLAGDDLGYDILPAPEGNTYAAHVAHKKAENEMIYVGSNDGMLHAIIAEPDNVTGGDEAFAYIPNSVISTNFAGLTNVNYTHQYFVDGSPQTGDVYFDDEWHTVIVGSMGAGDTSKQPNKDKDGDGAEEGAADEDLATGVGGHSVFALDVTNPDSFNKENVLWELSNRNDSDLGYTIPQPSVVRLNNGQWAALVANGYVDSTGTTARNASLFIINIQTGSIIKKIVASTTGIDNGLSSPIPVDVNNDRITDYVYAGDLKGNLWKFDISSADPNLWNVAFSGNPLYIACTTTTCSTSNPNDPNRQPITSKPTVIRADKPGQESGGFMVFFGTGKYFENNDQVVGTTPQIQTFYGIWDRCQTLSPTACSFSNVSNRSQLQRQQITNEGSATFTNDTTTVTETIRLTSACDVAYGTSSAITTSAPCNSLTNRLGWYMDLIQPSATVGQGERIISQPLVSGDAVVFPTVIPLNTPCEPGGTGWLMLLRLNGGRFTGSPVDYNEDGVIDAEDTAKLSGGAQGTGSGLKSKEGVIFKPFVVAGGNRSKLDHMYIPGSEIDENNQSGTDKVDVCLEEDGDCSDDVIEGVGIRRSWLQLR